MEAFLVYCTCGCMVKRLRVSLYTMHIYIHVALGAAYDIVLYLYLFHSASIGGV